MRSEEEKKTLTKTIKLSQKQYDKIIADAEKHGMKFSGYMAMLGMNGGGADPQFMVDMQNLWNICFTEIKKTNPALAGYVKSEVNRIWKRYC